MHAELTEEDDRRDPLAIRSLDKIANAVDAASALEAFMEFADELNDRIIGAAEEVDLEVA